MAEFTLDTTVVGFEVVVVERLATTTATGGRTLPLLLPLLAVLVTFDDVVPCKAEEEETFGPIDDAGFASKEGGGDIDRIATTGFVVAVDDDVAELLLLFTVVVVVALTGFDIVAPLLLKVFEFGPEKGTGPVVEAVVFVLFATTAVVGGVDKFLIIIIIGGGAVS